LNAQGFPWLLCAAFLLVGEPALGEEKAVLAAKGTVGKLLTIPDEYKKAHVIAYFTLEKSEGKLVEKAKAVAVTLYKDAKIERLDGGKRVPAKAADIKPGQGIELYDLEESVRMGDSMRIAARSVVVVEKEK
jgi:hypothetical protein